MPIKILIAHQSAIPHYRVDFFNRLNNNIDSKYEFDVVFDNDSQKKYFLESLDDRSFKFSILKTKTYSLKIFNRTISFQNFIFSIKGYDLIIIEDAINNISYPICHLLKPFYGYKIVKWGHGCDRGIVDPNWIKLFFERIKLILIKISDGYLAYTEGVKKYLVKKNIKENKIFVINNTIDINRNHSLVDIKKIDEYRKELKIDNKNILLYVGRVDKRKNIPFLIKSLIQLKKEIESFMMIVIGDGDKEVIKNMINKIGSNFIRYEGPIIEPIILSKYYTVCDLFLFPGDVGLGPLTAISYNALPIIIESNTHNPEIEYLNNDNSVILPKETNCEVFAETISEYLNDKNKIKQKNNRSWKTIKHLTLEAMVNNFSASIERLKFE